MRKSAVKRIEQGESPEAVAQGIGFNRRTIYRWLSNYHYGGEDALTAKPIPGAPQKLDAREMQQLSRIIREKNPLQLNLETAVGWFEFGENRCIIIGIMRDLSHPS